ncbi:MAG: hypothetical protein KTR32_40010 [Granulosicoccus sp.]|nr:hypothetical protein [Granulosicoccus sp.]
MKRKLSIAASLAASIVAGLGALLLPTILAANEVEVVEVAIQSLGSDKYRINVTLLHEDAGWDHFADRWDVLDESGEVLGSRVLAHPHDNEQPFTRSLTLKIPPTVKNVTIRANDSVHGIGESTMTKAVPRN